MKIEIKHLTTRNETAEGFPLVIEISHQNKRKRKNIAFCKSNHFIADGKMISTRHPDFDFLAPIIMNLKLKARKIVLSGVTDVNKAFDELFSVSAAETSFNDFTTKLIADMHVVAGSLGKVKDYKAQNNTLGNIKVYENVFSQFEIFGQNVSLQNLDYEVLMRFRNYQVGLGNSKSTIHLYLRTLRSIYNKGIATHNLVNKMPFAGVFNGLKVRSFDNKNKYFDKDTIIVLERLDLKTEKQKYVDLFLLQFYFGGCDLIDLYYLKNKQLKNGRVIYSRAKINTGKRIDLKIHPKASRLLEKYKTPGEWVFPWKKEKQAYETFRRTYQRGLIYVQEKTEIELLPDGGNIGAKVARHTFANLAKRLNITPDIIRELMGHERDEVDNYYKDAYPVETRDFALFEIISSFTCLK